jgi:hypothetical protein
VTQTGYLTVIGFDPSGNGEEREFKILTNRVDHLQRNGPTHKYYELLSVAEVLKGPEFIFEGLQRDGQENAYCYIGKPQQHGSGWQGPTERNMVFLVCVTERFTIFEWGWEREDENNPGLPFDTKRRFKKVKWKHSSST